MTSARLVEARDGAWRRVTVRDGEWRRVVAREKKLRCVGARVVRDRQNNNFERRVEARAVFDCGEASTSV